MNPELRRQFWQQWGLHRALVMPAILGLVFGAAFLTDPDDPWSEVDDVARAAAAIILGVWGCWLAGRSVLGEVAERTWDAQRSAALSPWQMTIGKLVGGTSYGWYGGGIALLMMVVAALNAEPEDRWTRAWDVRLAGYIVAALAAQALSLFLSLLLIRLSPVRSAPPVILPVIGAACAGVVLLMVWSDTVGGGGTVTWAGHGISETTYVVCSFGLLAVWLWVGCARLIRLEMQYRNGPWAWIGFLVVLGLWLGPLGTYADDNRVFALCIAYLVATWLSAFLEPKHPARLTRLFQALRAVDLGRIRQLLPAWLSAFAFAVVAATAALVLHADAAPPGTLRGDLWIIWGLVGFVLRDVALIHLFTFPDGAPRRHLMVVVYMALLHALLPWFLDVLGSPVALAFFRVTEDAPGWLVALAPFAEAVVLWVWLLRRASTIATPIPSQRG